MINYNKSTQVYFAVFTKFPCRMIDISAIIQRIMLISSASPSSWLIVVLGHSHFTLLHRDGNLHGCQCDDLFVKTSSRHPMCWLKMHVKVLTIRCASKRLTSFIHFWLTHWRCGSNFKSIPLSPYRIVVWALAVILLLVDGYRTSRMRSQHWFRL